jgi:hypothetical protein
MGAANPAELGWSIQGLANAYQAFATLTPASMVVIDRGRLVVAWGDTARRVKLSSVRKGLLSALYGTPVRDGRIKLDDTLEKLEIDDDPPLTHGEKQATLRMLSSRTTVEGRVWFVAICRGMTAVAKRDGCVDVNRPSLHSHRAAISRKDVIWPRRWLGEARCFKHGWPNTSE